MLSLGVRRGSLIQIGPDPLDVLEVVDVSEPLAPKVTFRGSPEFAVTELQRHEIMPNVFIQCGLKPDAPFHIGRSRIGFDAPESIRIERVGYALHP